MKTICPNILRGSNMTIFGGKDRGDGVIIDGFLTICTKCGWHSEVDVGATASGDAVIFVCKRCDNRGEVISS